MESPELLETDAPFTTPLADDEDFTNDVGSLLNVDHRPLDAAFDKYEPHLILVSAVCRMPVLYLPLFPDYQPDGSCECGWRVFFASAVLCCAVRGALSFACGTCSCPERLAYMIYRGNPNTNPNTNPNKTG